MRKSIFAFKDVPADVTIALATLKAVMQKMLSMLALASIIVGMPFAVPRPCSCRWIIVGTVTAGEVDASTKLKALYLLVGQNYRIAENAKRALNICSTIIHDPMDQNLKKVKKGDFV